MQAHGLQFWLVLIRATVPRDARTDCLGAMTTCPPARSEVILAPLIHYGGSFVQEALTQERSANRVAARAS